MGKQQMNCEFHINLRECLAARCDWMTEDGYCQLYDIEREEKEMMKHLDDEEIIDFDKFVGIHEGATAVIVGSGPTAGLFDPAQHPNALTFTCNRGTALPWFWDYGCVYDEGTVAQSWYRPGRFNLRCFYHHCLFSKASTVRYMRDQEFSPIGKFYCTTHREVSFETLDPKKLFRLGSSISVLTQMAAWMGCKDIYFYGVDMISPPEKFEYFIGGECLCNTAFYNSAGLIHLDICKVLKQKFNIKFYAKPPNVLVTHGLAEVF